MTVTVPYIDRKGFPRWADAEELEHQRAEWEAEKGLEYLERGPERPDLEPYDYSGDYALDGPDRTMFGRPNT